VQHPGGKTLRKVRVSPYVPVRRTKVAGLRLGQTQETAAAVLPKAGLAAFHPWPGRSCLPATPLRFACRTAVGGDVWPVRVKVGDKVRAEATIHAGRVAVRGSGSFKVGNAGAISATCCKLLDRADGCGYARRPALPPPAEAGAVRRGRRR
jgi:hypothetical protein